ncbi:MAG TPA: PIG-L family deacetylase, partial [Candidatus Hydrogenedentes bacterium]|nr:PIG-L family deacetylase [Candidatus Hydrogenedentota bacterium]
MLLGFFAFAPFSPGQDLSETAFRQALLDLGNNLRLLCVAAHPDDEDGATLALHRYKYGVKTYALIATRGEGGQNEIGPELYEDLAALRTREMQAAAAITGAELRFLDLPDFGYSKTIEETHAIWGETETLRRVVRKIREIRPHVIITHHGREKDHGHHQAIGKAVIDGFDLAGDATAFPEQFAEGLETWRPSRLYIRAWTPGPDSVTLDLAKLESLRGMTYAEITAKALEAHASQGMSFFIERYLSGRPKAHYDLVRQVRDAATGNEDVAGPLFAGLPAGVHPAHRRLAESRASRPEALDALLPLVASDSDETFAKKAARAAVCAAELRIEAHAEDPVVIPGQAVRIQADLRDFGRHDATSVTFACAWGGAEEIPDPFTVSVQEGAAAWECMLSTPRDMGTGEAEARVVAHVMCAGGAVPMESTVRVEVAPATRIEFAGAPYLARKDGDRVVRCDLLCTNHASAAREDVVRIEAPEGWSADVAEHPLRFDHEDQQWAFTVTLRLPESVAEGVYEVRARARDGVD